MEQEQQLSTRWEGYVDWRNRAAIRGRHGGMLAASFVLVAEILENLAYLANASNLVLYLSEYMHLSPSKAANNVTDFMGTAFLLALLGGFLSDAFFTTYHIYLISTVIEFLNNGVDSLEGIQVHVACKLQQDHVSVRNQCLLQAGLEANAIKPSQPLRD